MPLYNPQLSGAIEATKTAKELTTLQYRKSEEQVLVDMTNLYYNAQIIQNQLVFLDSNIVNSQRLLKNMQLLKEQLMAKGTDVNKVQLQVSQLQTLRAMATSKYEQILNALKFAMGVSLDAPLSIEADIRYDNPMDYSLNNPIELKIAQTQQKLVATELSNIQKSRLPSVGLVASYGTTGFGYDTRPKEFLKFFPLGFAGIQFSYPLFNGTVTQRKINQKNIELQNSALQQSMVTEQNKMQIANATMQRTAALQSMTHTKAQMAQADNIYQQTLLQQKQGVASLTDVLQADTALREAQQNHLAAMVDYLKADLELKKYSGNLSK
jgi:OMF family outer membrane factor